MNESAVKDVLWRALTDKAFRTMLQNDMDGALQDYELGEEDKSFLTKVLSDKPGQIDDLGSYLSQLLEERDNKGFVFGGG